MLQLKHILAPLLLLATLSACGDDPKKIAGDSCEDGSECESGMCIEQQCLAPLGAPCAADAECASGACIDEVCANTTDSGVTEFFFFGPKLGVEDNDLGGAFLPGMTYSETLGITRAGITVGAECIADAFFRSADNGESSLRTTVRCYPATTDSEAPLPYTSGPASMVIAHEVEDDTNDFGHTEAADAYDTHIIAAGKQSGHPADADILVGQGLRSYTVTTANGSVTRGRELNAVVAIRKSKDLKATALEGEWGFVTLSAEARSATPSASYGSGYFAATIGAAVGVGGMSLLPTSDAEFEVTQALSGANGQPIEVSQNEGDGEGTVPIAVSPSGAVSVGGTELIFTGALSPQGDFMTLYHSTPATWPPFEGEGPIDVPSADDATFLVTWGVKRALDPVATLAGKEYRVVRFAFRAEAGRFVIIYNTDDPTLSFDPTAATANFVATESEFAVSFAGGLFPKKAPRDARPLNVGLGHAQSFALTADGSELPSASGYVSQDGRLLVFTDGTAQLNAVGAPLSATTGIAFGVCTNCDSLTAD